ncbi:hypothetical protein [Priestia taiwanensis]|uniref:Uncharacterized protein n=1 Tax=Priestia taiwanensis TaxID=1347902 RepID=A0A917AUI0_9BACI|nr:hypothetical protein [Priestia taiwanensis]MBM7364086.1 hypothetical protein [Priestia taiwanensis]GGE71499.1 hypothetical protein GCM10007140_21790 [Priestia taiwanensis]
MEKMYVKKVIDFKEDSTKKIWIDRENNLVLLAIDEKGEGYIMHSNMTTSVQRYFPIDTEFNLDYLLFVQPIGVENWLLIMWGEEGEDNRAVIVNEKGEKISEFDVGEGIADCQVDKDDIIWISYVDEGVFSGHTLTQDGIIAFNKDGEVVFQKYGQFVDEGIVRPINDCYAMNVTNDSVWLCYYSDFPLVQLKDGKIHRQWDVEPYIERPHDFAVGEDKVLFCSSNKLEVYSLTDNGVFSAIPYNEYDEEIQFHHCFGRGSILYLQTEEALYCIDVKNSDR